MVPETNKVALLTTPHNQTENWCRKIHNVHSIFTRTHIHTVHSKHKHTITHHHLLGVFIAWMFAFLVGCCCKCCKSRYVGTNYAQGCNNHHISTICTGWVEKVRKAIFTHTHIHVQYNHVRNLMFVWVLWSVFFSCSPFCAMGRWSWSFIAKSLSVIYTMFYFLRS